MSGGGLVRQDILIVNVSQAGAMVELPAGTVLPDQLTLLFEHRLQPCTTVWQNERYAGLHFDNNVSSG